MDDYASKGSSVHGVKKWNRAIHGNDKDDERSDSGMGEFDEGQLGISSCLTFTLIVA